MSTRHSIFYNIPYVCICIVYGTNVGFPYSCLDYIYTPYLRYIYISRSRLQEWMYIFLFYIVGHEKLGRRMD